MAKKFWNTIRFKEIQEIWYEKLKSSEFNDIENENGLLKQNAGNSYRTTNGTLIEGKRRYYELLGHGLHDEEFRSEVDRLVIELRSEGRRIKDICEELERIGERRHTDTVRKILRYYEGKWKITRKA